MKAGRRQSWEPEYLHFRRLVTRAPNFILADGSMVLRERGSTGEDNRPSGRLFSLRAITKPKRYMKYNARWAPAVVGAFALILNSATAAAVTFETVFLGPSGYRNGSGGEGNLTLEGVVFKNSYESLYGSWSGFAISNHTDTATAGFLNQYSALAGTGANGSQKYAVGYDAVISFNSLIDLNGQGASFTNTTYAGLSMRNGDSFAKKFGGTTGNDPDWLLLTIDGYFGGVQTASSVKFYLADFRFSNNSQDYIVGDWKSVDFSALGTVNELRFRMSSSDNGTFGMNTPAYFAMDSFSVPEPSSLLLTLLGSGFLIRRKR